MCGPISSGRGKGQLTTVPHCRVMRVFVYSIAADPESPAEETGYVRAGTAEEAVALVGHPEVSVYHLPADTEWPGEAHEAIWPWRPEGKPVLG